MGKYKNGINGPFSGKIGTVVGATSRGVDYMRSVPDIRVDNPSEKQIRMRNIMTLISCWLKPLKSIIAIGFKVLTGSKTPLNEVFALIFKEALIVNGNEISIDYKNVVLSKGELLLSFVFEILTLIDSLVHIKWQNFNASIYNKSDDKATFVLYNPAKEKFVTFVGVANREAEQAELKLPAEFAGDTLHCWMQYVNVEGDKVSTSAYLGEIVVG
ncbi:DUF6266 family protein [Pedobacter sp. JCM 36344]|uniref:DUF6266 family protein n=1 Tax=Pedobacter sp. JCM 36344 TaxID=3374280 RepID=UPI00397B31BC